MKKICFVVMVIALLGLLFNSCGPSIQEQIEELRSQVADLEAENEELQSQIDDLESEKEELQSENNRLTDIIERTQTACLIWDDDADMALSVLDEY